MHTSHFEFMCKKFSIRKCKVFFSAFDFNLLMKWNNNQFMICIMFAIFIYILLDIHLRLIVIYIDRENKHDPNAFDFFLRLLDKNKYIVFRYILYEWSQNFQFRLLFFNMHHKKQNVFFFFIQSKLFNSKYLIFYVFLFSLLFYHHLIATITTTI